MKCTLFFCVTCFSSLYGVSLLTGTGPFIEKRGVAALSTGAGGVPEVQARGGVTSVAGLRIGILDRAAVDDGVVHLWEGFSVGAAGWLIVTVEVGVASAGSLVVSTAGCDDADDVCAGETEGAFGGNVAGGCTGRVECANAEKVEGAIAGKVECASTGMGV